MDIKRLKLFVAVAEELNILKAANRMNISQPPLTRHIKLLEDELKTQLFIRTARGVTLTDAGRILLDEARNLISLSELAAERTFKAGQGLLGRIDVGIFSSAVFGVIPKILMAFRQKYPDVTVVMHSLNKAQQIEALRQRRITVGFNRFFEYMEDLSVERISTESLFLAINRNHPLARKKLISWSELADHPLVLFPSTSRPSFIDWLTDICIQDGFKPNIVQEVGDSVNALALVASGFGMAIIPESATNMRVSSVVYRPLTRDPMPVVDLSCVYRKNDESPILKAFLLIARDPETIR